MTAAVVKLGGSLLGGDALDALLAVAARARAVVVPGGGPFADAVRAAQAVLGTSEPAAHRMAILAMEQTALLLSDRAPEFELCGSPAEIAATIRSGRPAIWRPWPAALGADAPESWDTTSDSLALWLAIELRAPRLVLAKAAAVAPDGSPADWARSGIVDRHFPTLAARFAGDTLCAGPASADTLAACLYEPRPRAA